jgi:hypothetical protein
VLGPPINRSAHECARHLQRRRKIEDNPNDPTPIRTERSAGCFPDVNVTTIR